MVVGFGYAIQSFDRVMHELERTSVRLSGVRRRTQAMAINHTQEKQWHGRNVKWRRCPCMRWFCV